MPASPNAVDAGRGTSANATTPADVRHINSRSATLTGSRTGYRTWGIITLVLATAVLLRISIAATLPLVEPTEGRYAQISKEMLLSGDWVTPRLWIDGEQVPYLGKPPLFFWSAALSIKLFGANELAVRLPSLVAAAALLILMYYAIGRYLGSRTALLAVLITATSPLVFGAAGTVILDLHLTFFVVGALLAYLAFTLEPDPATQKRWSFAVFVLLAGGFLTKGPVALVLFGLPVFLWTVLHRKWRLLGRHAWLPGIAVFILVVAPWFVLAELRNPGFLRYFFINENLLRYFSPEYGDLYGTGHRFPLGAAAPMFLVASLPWSPMAAWLMLKHRGFGMIRKAFSDDISFFLFLGFAANVVFWCFARQLLGTYLLPTIPLFSIWLAHVVVGSQPGGGQNLSRIAACASVAWVILFLAVGPIAAEDSARGVLVEASEIARRNHISGRVVFAGRTPYSAVFYSPDAVAIHPKRSPDATLTEEIENDASTLLIFSESEVGKIPENLRQYLQPVASQHHWMFLVTPVSENHSPPGAGDHQIREDSRIRLEEGAALQNR
jgi:4-amino-4-deoxy-L-arabinose transferase-like glycosyltransferase